MEKKYKDIPNENPTFGTFYCPWCATKQTTHMNVFTVYCSGCGRTLTHDGKTQNVPQEAELKNCSYDQLLFMLQEFCTVSAAYNLARSIAKAFPENKSVQFAVANALWKFKETKDEGWMMLLKLAEEKNYDALATVYNAYFSEDLKWKVQLKKYSEILVREFGDQTAANTLRTILQKEGQ